MKMVKIRIQGDSQTIELVRSYLLQIHEGLILSKPKKGNNPKYENNQIYASYGDIQFTSLGKKIQKEKKRRRS